MKTNNYAQRHLCAALLACFGMSIATAQSLPQLSCKRLNKEFTCGGLGQGGVTTMPSLLPLNAYGNASWTYLPPADSINMVSFAYNIPNVSSFITGSYCGAATRNISVVVSNADLYSSITENSAIAASSIVSNSSMSYSTANPLSKALSSTVETVAQANTYWTVVVKEGDWALRSSATGQSWSRNAAVCKLYVSAPVFYAPPSTYQ